MVVTFIKNAAKSRVGQLFVVAHLCLIIWVMSDKPALDRAAVNAIDENEVYSESLVAGRSFHYTHESDLLKFLLAIDIPGIFFGFVLGLIVSTILLILPNPLSPYDASWLTAALFLVGTSLQWWLTGYSVERLTTYYMQRRVPKG